LTPWPILFELLNLAEDLERATGKAWPTFQSELVELIGSSDEETANNELSRQIDRLIERLLATPGADLVRAALLRASKERMRSRYPQGGPNTDSVVVPVFYSTNRLWFSGAELHRSYGAERADLNFGVARVSVPLNRKLGDLPSPKWWRFELHQNPAKHVILLELNPTPADAFLVDLQRSLDSVDVREALVFVHGYNVSFADAALRAAQISVDLKFPGQVILYSWPSMADVRLYMADAAAVEWSTPHLETLLKTVLVHSGAERVHVIAHSMGNRPLVQVLQRLGRDALPQNAARLQQVVFAAPDVDRGVFCQFVATFANHAERLTLYASSNDVPLKLSKLLHRYPRAGDAGDDLVVIEGLDTVDASTADTSLFGLGHSYFANTRSILSDIYQLILRGESPDRRFDLAPASIGGHWIYRS
jgi:esterase/lipase superfamily enzyme